MINFLVILLKINYFKLFFYTFHVIVKKFEANYLT